METNQPLGRQCFNDYRQIHFNFNSLDLQSLKKLGTDQGTQARLGHTETLTSIV